MTEHSYFTEQDVFVDGVEALKVRSLISGSLGYRFSGDGVLSQVFCDTWLSEAAIWVKWSHAGQLSAGTCCQFAELDCEQLHQIVSRAGGPLFNCLQKFAILFLNFIGQLQEVGADITDLPLDESRITSLAHRAMRFHNFQYT